MCKNVKIKVSIIVPVYNSEKFLSECIISLVNQELKEIEIICINDGSTDNSLEILNDFAAVCPLIKVINTEHRGISAARNTGLDIARGEFIGFTDSDDKVEPDFYLRLYNAAQKYGADIACGGIIRFGGKKARKYLSFGKTVVSTVPARSYELAKIPKYNYIWNKIYRTKSLILSGIRFKEGVNFEDIEFTHKVLYFLKKMVFVPNLYYYYRDTQFSVVNQLTETSKDEYFQAFHRAHNFVAKYNINWKYDNNYPSKHRWIFNFLGLKLISIKKMGSDSLIKLLGIPFISIKNRLK